MASASPTGLSSAFIPLRRCLGRRKRRTRVFVWWSRLDRWQLFVLNKLLTGEFRVGMSHTLVVRAVAQLAGLPTPVVEHRLMGNWEPSAAAFAALMAPEGVHDEPSQPVSVLPRVAARRCAVGARGSRRLARGMEMGRHPRAADSSPAADVFLWSRGEELITGTVPGGRRGRRGASRWHGAGWRTAGVRATAARGPSPICSSGLAASAGSAKWPRISRSCSSPTTCSEAAGEDIRDRPLRERRDSALSNCSTDRHASGTACASPSVVAGDRGRISPAVAPRSRERGVEGLMLKRWTSPTAPAVAAATGGSGRSSRTRSTRC